MASFSSTSILAGLVLASLSCGARPQNLPPELAKDLARVYAPSIAQTQQAEGLLTARYNTQTNSICLLPNVSAGHPIVSPRDVFSDWHCRALTVLAIDHIPNPGPDGVPQFYQNFGPHRASWAMAMFHLTLFEVSNAYLAHPRKSWITKQPGSAQYGDLSHGQGMESAAIAAAAYTILARMYPKFNDPVVAGKYGNLIDEYNASLAALNCAASPACQQGATFGASVAEAVFDLRITDNSSSPEIGWTTGFRPNHWAPAPFQWEIDPVSLNNTVLGAHWGAVTPFQIEPFEAAGQTIPAALTLKPPPVMLNFAVASKADKLKFYRDTLDNGTADHPGFRVLEHGSDPHHEPPEFATARTEEDMRSDYYQGIFWSYDGTAGICAPVRLYNQIADTLVRHNYHDLMPSGPDLEPGAPAETPDQSKDSAADLAYFYYVLNTGMADAGIAAWHYKYAYQYFRPVTGVNAFFHADDEMGPIRTEHLSWAPSWYPLGGQNTNTGNGYNPTPPFPAYPSGHSVFGGAFFTLLGKFFPDSTHQHISFMSDELNGGQSLGQNIDAYGYRRCRDPHVTGASPDYGYDAQYCQDFNFGSFSEASEANSISRIRLGVHWPADADNGKDLGDRVGERVCEKVNCPSGM